MLSQHPTSLSIRVHSMAAGALTPTYQLIIAYALLQAGEHVYVSYQSVISASAPAFILCGLSVRSLFLMGFAQSVSFKNHVRIRLALMVLFAAISLSASLLISWVSIKIVVFAVLFKCVDHFVDLPLSIEASAGNYKALTEHYLLRIAILLACTAAFIELDIKDNIVCTLFLSSLAASAWLLIIKAGNYQEKLPRKHSVMYDAKTLLTKGLPMSFTSVFVSLVFLVPAWVMTVWFHGEGLALFSICMSVLSSVNIVLSTVAGVRIRLATAAMDDRNPAEAHRQLLGLLGETGVIALTSSGILLWGLPLFVSIFSGGRLLLSTPTNETIALFNLAWCINTFLGLWVTAIGRVQFAMVGVIAAACASGCIIFHSSNQSHPLLSSMSYLIAVVSLQSIWFSLGLVRFLIFGAHKRTA